MLGWWTIDLHNLSRFLHAFILKSCKENQNRGKGEVCYAGERMRKRKKRMEGRGKGGRRWWLCKEVRHQSSAERRIGERGRGGRCTSWVYRTCTSRAFATLGPRTGQEFRNGGVEGWGKKGIAREASKAQLGLEGRPVMHATQL